MALNTVSELITALVSTYDAGLEAHVKWQRKRWQANHYKTHVKGRLSGSGSCGLSTSLSISGPKIREAFDSGADLLGSGFSVGDARCRENLNIHLELLQDRVTGMQRALEGTESYQLELFEILRVSEAVRLGALSAMAEQYQRVAVGRLVPLVLPGSQARSRPGNSVVPDDTTVLDDDAQTTYHTASSSKSPYQSEPPSPPPTPKMIPDDVMSTCTSEFGPRPKNSVFSTFCPEAMKYQVDLRKNIPTYRRCRCGYDWRQSQTGDKIAIMVKDGFVLTPRYLGKSHCADGSFACVLCTSTGKTQTYSTAELLKEHVNATHDKWQMLHDPDLKGH